MNLPILATTCANSRMVVHVPNLPLSNFVRPFFLIALTFLGLANSSLSATVNSDGSFSENIPISTPEGYQQMQPNLALSYNSNAGNGIAGVGWSLSGLRAITRGHNFKHDINFAQDNYLTGDGQDGYYADGSRLLDVGITSLYSVFHTSSDDLSKYEPTGGMCGDGPCSWIMTDRNGNKYFFGDTTNSQLVGSFPFNAAGSVRVWALSKVENAQGFSYEIQYEKDGGQIYPTKITYTKGSGLSYYRSVIFNYDKTGRPDKDLSYAASSSVQTNWRLSSVQVKFEVSCYWLFTCNKDVRDYNLSYVQSSNSKRSLISMIQEIAYANDGSTQVSWSQVYEWEATPFTLNQTWATAPENASWSTNYGRTIVGDFNGDGKSDIVLQGDGVNFTNYTSLQLSLGSSFLDRQILLDPFMNGAQLFDYTDSTTQKFTALGDIDGDGKTDIITSYIDNQSSSIIDKYIFSPDNTDHMGTRLVMLPKDNSQWSAVGRDLYTGDFNGDGRTDLLLKGRNASYDSYILLSTGLGNNLSFQRVDLGFALSDPKRLFIGDFNGDGRADFAHCNPSASAFEVYISSYGTFASDPISFRILAPSVNFYTSCGVYSSGNNVDDYDKLIIGDFNGDGKADIISPYVSTLWLSKGFGFIAAPNQITTFNPLGDMVLPGDFNGDGKDDLFIYSNQYTYSHNVNDPRSPINPKAFILLSNGSGFPLQATTGPNFYVWSDTGSQWHAAYSDVSLGDMNGDGIPDILINEKRPPIQLPAPTRALSLLVSGTHHNDKIKKITYDNRAMLQIEYTAAGALANTIKPLAPNCTTQYGSYFCDPVKPYGFAFGSLPNPTARSLVTKVTTSAIGVTDSFSTQYEYFNARYFNGAIDDRVSLGFEKVKITDVPSGNYSITYYNQSRPFMGVIRKTEGYLADNSKISEFVNGMPAQYYCNEFSCSPDSAGDLTPKQPRQIRISNNTTTQWENGVERLKITREDLSTDQYGNVLLTKETRVANGITDVRVTQTDVINQLSPTRAIGLTYQTKVCLNDCAIGTILSTERLYFDGGASIGSAGAKLQVSKRETRVTSSLWAAETYIYNSIGQVASSTNSAGQVTAFNYEPNYGIAVTGTAITSQGKTISHIRESDPRYGVATWDKDDLGREVQRTLDARGRMTDEVAKDAQGNTVSRRSISYSLDQASDRNITECGFIGNAPTPSQCSRIYLDNLNRKIKIVTSAINGITEKYQATFVDYDPRGRLWRTSLPEFADDLAGLNAVPQKYNIRSYDSLNRLQRIENADGRYLDLQYNPYLLANTASSQRITEGKLSTPGQKSKVVLADIRGRPVRVVESEGSPQQAIIDYTYSDLDQLTSVVSPQGTQTITYDPEFRWRTAISDPGVGTTTFTYESNLTSPAFGQVLTEIRPAANAAVGSSTTQTTSFEYVDAWGRQTKAIKPDGSVLQREYDDPAVNFGKNRQTKTTYDTNGYRLVDTFSYNARGENAGSHRQISHATLTLCPDGPNTLPCSSTVSAERDELGRIKSGLLSDGTVTEFQYIGGSQNLQSVKNNGHTYAAYSDYNKFGQPESIAYGNSVVSTFTFNPDNGLLETYNAQAGSQSLIDYEYVFDSRFNLKTLYDRVINGNANDLNYTYDANDRIKTAKRGANPTQSYQFDTNGPGGASRGNLLVKGNRIVNYPIAGPGVNRPTSDQIYDIYSLSWVANQTFTWSSAGNLKTKGAATYNYNADNMMSDSHDPATGDAEYLYDSGGQRFLKTFRRTGMPAIKTWYLDRTVELREKWDGTLATRLGTQQTKYIYGLDGKRLAAKTGALTIASAQISTQYYALADMANGKSISGISLKIKYTFYGFFAEPSRKRNALIGLLGFLALLLLLYIIKHSPPGKFDLRRLGWQQIVALPTVMVFFSVQCGTSAGNPTNANTITQSGNTGTYDGTTVDFNDVYSGLPAGEVYFHSDHLNGTALLTDASGAEIFRLAYDTYGALDISNSGKLNTGTGLIERSGDQVAFAILAYKFTGQEYDAETNFFYYNARYFIPELGIFSSADPVVDGPLSSSGYNRHMYVHGRPVIATDPTGNSAIPTATATTGSNSGSTGGWGGSNSYDNRYAPDGGSVSNGSTYGSSNVSQPSYGQPGSGPQVCQLDMSKCAGPTPAMVEESRKRAAQRQALEAARTFEQRLGEARNVNAYFDGSKTMMSSVRDSAGFTDSGDILSSHQAWQQATSQAWYENKYVQGAGIVIGAVAVTAAVILAAPFVAATAAAYTGGGAISTFIATGGMAVAGSAAIGGGAALASEMRAGQAIAQNAGRGQQILTTAGHEITKHKGIASSLLGIEARGTPNQYNQLGQQAVDYILQNGLKLDSRHHARFGYIYDVVLGNGLGARFNAVTGEFIHFLGGKK